MVSARETYEVVWPRGSRKDVASKGCASRLDALEGKTIGELWNGVFRGDQIFPMIEKELMRRYPSIKFVHYSQFGFTGGGDGAKTVAAIPGTLAEYGCDAVISAVGC